MPKSEEERTALAETIGQDGYGLLEAIYQATAPAGVRQVALVDSLRRIWRQQDYRSDGQVHWRTKQRWGQPPAQQMIASPEDLGPSTVSSARPSGQVTRFI